MLRDVRDVDRLATRHRPDGQPVMHQNWGKLLFMHWRMKEELLRPHIPPELEIDTFGGSAWIAITPFTMWDIRAFPPFIPPIPGLSSMHELNVRTYVHYNGVPGVWFFSLDTDSAPAALAARTFFRLPYFDAEIYLEQNEDVIDYELSRTDEPNAEFRASWKIGKELPRSQAGSREFFLTERYILYTEDDGELYRAFVHHEPWTLRQAELLEFSSDIITANGLPATTGQPILHYAEEISVDIFLLESVPESS